MGALVSGGSDRNSCISASFGLDLPGANSGSAYGCSVHLAATTGITTGAVSPSYSRIEKLNQRRFGLGSVMAVSYAAA
jgi:hypothetical protein